MIQYRPYYCCLLKKGFRVCGFRECQRAAKRPMGANADKLKDRGSEQSQDY